MNTINNFPPLKLRMGDWMMSRRMHDYKTSGVHFLVGGAKSLDAWESFPVLVALRLPASRRNWRFNTMSSQGKRPSSLGSP
jgi:hypothetical protein